MFGFKVRLGTTAWKVSVFRAFLVSFFRTRTEYGELQNKSPYSVRMRENMNQKNFEHGHFSRSVLIGVQNRSVSIPASFFSIFCLTSIYNIYNITKLAIIMWTNLYTNTNRRISQWKVHYFFKKYMMLLDDIELVNS